MRENMRQWQLLYVLSSSLSPLPDLSPTHNYKLLLLCRRFCRWVFYERQWEVDNSGVQTRYLSCKSEQERETQKGEKEGQRRLPLLLLLQDQDTQHSLTELHKHFLLRRKNSIGMREEENSAGREEFPHNWSTTSTRKAIAIAPDRWVSSSWRRRTVALLDRSIITAEKKKRKPKISEGTQPEPFTVAKRHPAQRWRHTTTTKPLRCVSTILHVLNCVL